MAGAVGSFGLHACTQPTKTSTESAIVPTAAAFGANPWIGQAPLFIAQDKGFFREAGLEMDVKMFGTNLESIPAFAAGQLQGCAAMPSSEAVTMAAKDMSYRIISVMDVSAGGDAILARNSVADIPDFKGKKVAVQVGGLGHFFLLQVLEEAGLSGKDVELVNTAPDAAAAVYQAGNVEIAYTYSPFLEKANEAQTDGRIIYDTSKMPTAIIDLNLVSTEFAETNPQAVQAFVAGIFKAQEFLQTNPDEAHAIVAKHLEIQPDEVETQLQGVRLPDLQTNLEMLNDPNSDLYLLKPMQSMAEFLNDQQQIDTIPDLSGILDPQFLSALNSQA
jgi:NitT/TauT family transport system substrate-binding protein